MPCHDLICAYISGVWADYHGRDPFHVVKDRKRMVVIVRDSKNSPWKTRGKPMVKASGSTRPTITTIICI